MKRTSAGILLTIALLAAIIGFFTDQLLVVTGYPSFTPLITLPVLLVALGAIVIVLAIPIRRAARGVHGARVNPFRAVQIAMLAKASSMLGAGATGFSLGLVVFLLTRPVIPSLGSMATQVTTLVAGLILVAAGLVAEYLCTIRKDDDDTPPGDADSGLGARGH
ncbi:hypothetical protein GCM10009808_23910 [Microbacterium sediminicola]|uniref:DUF3180 domain-containing protein n=1 Tax=Microbacterium sediminicola TaxID=415210 RepID=A0ABP4UJN9_9MICO